jgi:hypothetical protein
LTEEGDDYRSDLVIKVSKIDWDLVNSYNKETVSNASNLNSHIDNDKSVIYSGVLSKTIKGTGSSVDKLLVTEGTRERVSEAFTRAGETGECSEAGCNFANINNNKLLAHVESHYLIYACACGFLASNRETTARHRRGSHEDSGQLTQVDYWNWVEARKFITGLPNKFPSLPMGLKLSTGSCMPPGKSNIKTRPGRQRGLDPIRAMSCDLRSKLQKYTIPKIVATVPVVEEVDVVADLDPITPVVPVPVPAQRETARLEWDLADLRRQHQALLTLATEMETTILRKTAHLATL